MLEDIDTWLFKYADDCMPERDKCLYCEYHTCDWYRYFQEEIEDESNTN